jgi:hypothetical protein
MIGVVALSALGGAIAGCLAGFVAAVLILQAKRLRNARLAKHGAPGVKDCVLTPLWMPGGLVGLVGGGIAGAITGSWRVAAIVGLAFPAAILVLAIALAIRQSRDTTILD